MCIQRDIVFWIPTRPPFLSAAKQHWEFGESQKVILGRGKPTNLSKVVSQICPFSFFLGAFYKTLAKYMPALYFAKKSQKISSFCILKTPNLTL